jgi:hypothetical protein
MKTAFRNFARTTGIALISMSVLTTAAITPAAAEGSFSISVNAHSAEDREVLRSALQLYSIMSALKGGSGVHQAGDGNNAGLRQQGPGNLGIVHQDGRGHQGSLQQLEAAIATGFSSSAETPTPISANTATGSRARPLFSAGKLKSKAIRRLRHPETPVIDEAPD